MKKIDIHSHITNRILLDNIIKNPDKNTLIDLMRQHDVEKSVVLASYFPHKGTGISNYRLLHWIKDNPELLLFGSLDFEHYYYQGLNELNELSVEGKLRGIKIYTTYQNIDLNSKQMQDIVDIARNANIPMMLHTGESHNAQRMFKRDSISWMVISKNIEPLMQKNPEVDFIFSHMSMPHIDELIYSISHFDNAYTDISGLLNSTTQHHEILYAIDYVKKYLDHCGHSKLLFGTDFPIQTHEDSIYIIEESMKNYPANAKEDVYYNNAEKILRRWKYETDRY